MNELDKLLNPTAAATEPVILKKTEKPSAATLKANTLAAQENTIAAASVGGALFRSADTLLVDIPKIKGHIQK